MTDKNIFDEVINRTGTYSTQWDYVEDRFGEKDLLPFTISDTDFSVPNVIMTSLKDRLKHPVFGYTRWNHLDYKSSIISWYSDRFDTNINPDWIVYSPSVMYSVARLIELYSSEGDGVIIQTPAYDAFFKTINGSKRDLVENPLVYHDGIYQLDFQDLEDKLSKEKNKILLICSPHNPTGRVWKRDELNRIVKLCKKYNVFLISDEIHMDIVRKEFTHVPILDFSDVYDRIALCTSPSKTFNIPGLGGSYLCVANDLTNEKFQFLLKNRDGVSSANILGITATMSAYNDGTVWVENLNKYVTKNLEFVKSFLEKELPELTFKIPDSTYLAWIDIEGLPFTMEQLQNALVQHGKVAIMDGSVYGGNGNNFLRLNVGCPRSKLIEGLSRLKKAIEYLKKDL